MCQMKNPINNPEQDKLDPVFEGHKLNGFSIQNCGDVLYCPLDQTNHVLAIAIKTARADEAKKYELFDFYKAELEHRKDELVELQAENDELNADLLNKTEREGFYKNEARFGNRRPPPGAPKKLF